MNPIPKFATKMRNNLIALLLLSSLAGARLHAVELNSFFSDNMVPQQNKPLRAWGTGRDGEKTGLRFADWLQHSVHLCDEPEPLRVPEGNHTTTSFQLNY